MKIEEKNKKTETSQRTSFTIELDEALVESIILDLVRNRYPDYTVSNFVIQCGMGGYFKGITFDLEKETTTRT